MILNEDQIEELKLAFEMFDESQQGFLTKDNLKTCLDKYRKRSHIFHKVKKVRCESTCKTSGRDVQRSRCYRSRKDWVSRVHEHDGQKNETGL